VDVVGVAGRRVVRPAGRLFGEDVTIFERICNDEPLPFRIDLEDLLSADQAGLAVLLRQKVRGVSLTRVPGYIRIGLASAAKLAGGLPARARRKRSSSEPPDASNERRAQ
jgi:hypothetical protein